MLGVICLMWSRGAVGAAVEGVRKGHRKIPIVHYTSITFAPPIVWSDCANTFCLHEFD